MKRILILLSFICIATLSYAELIDGVEYKNVYGDVSVVPRNDGVKYSGAIVVREKVVLDGQEVSVTRIGKKAFQYCDELTSLTLPSTISIIDTTAFRNNSSLREIYLFAENPPRPHDHHDWFLNGVNRHRCVLYVPQSAQEKYESDPDWWSFRNIETIEGQTRINSTAVKARESRRYTIDGKLTNEEHGLFIIVYDDGTSRPCYK